MKLLNHTLSYLSIAFLPLLGIWAVIFYVNFLDEIYDSIDDELENTKILIINRIGRDSTLLQRTAFMESHYTLEEIPADEAFRIHDTYKDSTLFMVNEQEYEPVRVLHSAFRAENGRYYDLLVFSSMVEEDDLIEDLLYSLIWLYIFLLVSILLINNVLLKKIWKPFYQIIDRINVFSVEKPEPFPAPIETSVTEFKNLNETITGLLERTTAAFNSQKQFIENASHELQTPVAISINKLELLAERNADNPSQLQEISSVIEILERLKRLNKSLLLLTRIENKQFTGRTMTSINEITRKRVNEFTDLAAYKSVSLTVHEEGDLTVETNAELTSMMISNLLKNAINHNIEGGTVDIRIDTSSITIENSGKPSALNGAEIFKRFYKETELQTSLGLGLPIVKSIADFLQYEVRYEFNGKHKFIILIKK